MQLPPIKSKVAPAAYTHSSDATYARLIAISSGEVNRPIGIIRRTTSCLSGGKLAICSVSLVAGENQLTVMLSPTTSRATDFVNATIAPFGPL